MSDINGNGYGDKHDWERGETEHNPIPEKRSTWYRCRKCGEPFRHWYHMVKDIHEAMELFEVIEDCV